MKKPAGNVQEYTEAKVIVPRSLADAVSSYITDNIASGIALDESESANMVGIKFYVPKSGQRDFRPAFQKYLSQIVSVEMPEVPRILESTVASRDWELAYKKSIKPVLIGKDICVRPPWAKIPVGVKFDIIIEPKMAFGTGQHETTKACLQLIHKHFQSGWRFLDFGCGSGVLSILSDQLGARYIKAVDYDITAIENCCENFDINGVKSKNEILFGSFEKAKGDSPYDLVCANLNKQDLMHNFLVLKKLTKSKSFLILSGILESEKAEIEKTIREGHMTIVDFIHQSEWLTYCLRK